MPYKELRKKVSTILQIIIIIVGLLTILYGLKNPKLYKATSSEQWTNQEGFIALSYTGFAKEEGKDLVTIKQFEGHMKALKTLGYETISHKDMIDFYKEGKKLPEKALYLMIEEGRTDSFMFVQPILEELNYKAHMYPYASKVVEKDNFFLGEKELEKMSQNSFWEIGIKGDGFADRHEEGEGSPKFYFADYLRDEMGNILESDEEMEQRMNRAFQEEYDVFNEILVEPARAYIFVPANVLGQSMPLQVEEVTRSFLEGHYQLMFTREGSSYNNQEVGIYNLSRKQVQPSWSAKQLIEAIDGDIEYEKENHK